MGTAMLLIVIKMTGRGAHVKEQIDISSGTLCSESYFIESSQQVAIISPFLK